jgi:hypothetical protein
MLCRSLIMRVRYGRMSRSLQRRQRQLPSGSPLSRRAPRTQRQTAVSALIREINAARAVTSSSEGEGCHPRLVARAQQ